MTTPITYCDCQAALSSHKFRLIHAIRIACEPAGQPRAYPAGRGKFSHMITDWRYRTGAKKGQYRPSWHFRQAVTDMFYFHRLPEPLDEPLRVQVVAFFPRPKYMLAKKWPDEAIPKASTPDADNVQKLVQDGINGTGYWSDDQIVFWSEAVEYYVPRGKAPCAWVMIEALEKE